MSTLIIHLPATPATAAGEYAWALSSDGEKVQRHGCCAAAALPAVGRTGRIVAIAPHQALSWHLVTLPLGIYSGGARAQTRLRAVLDGLLEERLLDDSSQLHLALEPHARAGSTCWVAACDKNWLGSHLRALQAAGRAANRIAPLCPPQAEAALWLVGSAQSPWLLATGWQTAAAGATAQQHPASIACLPCGPQHGSARMDAAAVAALLHTLPPEVPVQAYPALARQAQNLQRPTVLISAAEHALAASAQGWDLAQFDFDLGRSSRLRQGVLALWQHFWRTPQYRPARWAALLALLAQVIGLNAWAWQENRAIAQRRAQVRAVLLESFPQTPLVIDAPLQMQREVSALRQRAARLAPADLEPLLAAAAHVTPPGVLPQALHYEGGQGGQLRLDGMRLPAADLAQAQQRLTARGVRLQQEGDSLILRAE